MLYKQKLNLFDFWENFVIEKSISDALAYVGRYTIGEIISNHDKTLTKIKESLDNIGIELDMNTLIRFFKIKNIKDLIRVARNGFNIVNKDAIKDNVYICGGDVYYYIIEEDNEHNLYLKFQWRSLFYELVTDNDDKVKGQAKHKLIELINIHFPLSKTLKFDGVTEGTRKMFQVTDKNKNNDGYFYISIKPLKKQKIGGRKTQIKSQRKSRRKSRRKS